AVGPDEEQLASARQPAAATLKRTSRAARPLFPCNLIAEGHPHGASPSVGRKDFPTLRRGKGMRLRRIGQTKSPVVVNGGLRICGGIVAAALANVSALAQLARKPEGWPSGLRHQS